MKVLKIVVITQGVSRIVQPLLDGKHDLVGVIESATRDVLQKKEPAYLYKFARKLYALFKKKNKSLRSLAYEKKIAYRYMVSSNDEGLEEWLKKLQPDLIVVFSMSQLLKENIFSIPVLGTINIHPSMLPDYRGPNPDFWQYINLEMEPGVTIHYIDEGEDTGDILRQERVHIPLGTKSPERLDRLIGDVGVKNLLKIIEELASGTAKSVKQPEESPTARARNIKPEEHKNVIDWRNWETPHVWHVLRGTELWLNALEQPKGLYKGQRWSVGEYILVDKQLHSVRSIFRLGKGYVVATKDGYIKLSVRFSVKRFILHFLKNKS